MARPTEMGETMNSAVSAEDKPSGVAGGGSMVSAGSVQGGVVAGRDIIFGDTTEFFETRFDDVKPPEYLMPPVAGNLVERLLRQRLLILGGHELADRGTLARHLAWLLKTRIETRAEEGELEVRQWSREVDRGRLLASFQRFETSTVFLLLEARPSQFGCDFRQLRDDLARNHHFAILSTVSESSQWGIGDPGAEESWFAASSSQVFPARRLAEFLERMIEEVAAKAGTGVAASFLCGVEPEEVAKRLETPNRVRRFVRSLASAGETLDAAGVRRELEQNADGQGAIQRWYRNLDRRHQLLAMGMVLFDGLYDDQVFAALEEIMNAIWKAWEPQLSQFDFRDLEELRTYFPSAGVERQISCRSEAVRQGILEVAWTLHRRYLMAALPVSIELLKRAIRTTGLEAEAVTGGTEEESGEPSPDASRSARKKRFRRRAKGRQAASPAERDDEADPVDLASKERLAWNLEGRSLELWGSSVRSAMLRDSTGDALSRLSQLSADGLDSHLRALASDPVSAVRLVAAEALAGWRRTVSGEKALFEKLREWNARTLETEGEGRRSDLPDVEQRRSLASVRATVAMAVGYAARHDPQDRMRSDLQELFEGFLEEKNPVVQEAFSEVTMPLVMGTHLVQLEALLKESARRRTWLRRGLALGFVLALELRSNEALATMDTWHAQSQGFAPEIQPGAHARARENVLAALIEAYSLFSSFSQFELFGIEVVFSKFQRILAEERGRYLRRLTLWGALVQFRRRPAQAEPLLQELVAEATLEERADLLEGFGFIFWDQRQSLEGGDASVVLKFPGTSRWSAREAQPLAWDEIVVRGLREFGVWFRSARPWTPVELMLRRWLQDEDHPIAQQLALEALASLHAKERWLMAYAKTRRELQLDWQALPPEIRSLERAHRLSFAGRLVTYLSVSEASGLRDRVLALLPQLLRQVRSAPLRLATDGLLESWRSDPDPGLARLTARLKLTSSLYHRRHLILATLAAALAGFILMMRI